MASFGGFVWGMVVDNADPLGIGRAMIRIEGAFEPYHPEWAVPLGWPGSGHQSKGSYHPPKIGTQVAVIFEHGDTSAPPGYLAGPPAAPDGVPDAPQTATELFVSGVQELSTEDVADPKKATAALASVLEPLLALDVIWEDETFAFFVTSTEDDKRFVIVEKNQRAYIAINATDGASGKATTIQMFANTSISIESKGAVDIKGSVVQIQGRRVLEKPLTGGGVSSI